MVYLTVHPYSIAAMRVSAEKEETTKITMTKNLVSFVLLSLC